MSSVEEQEVKRLELREAAERHRVTIQEFWARVNIHLILQTGLLSAYALLASQNANNQHVETLALFSGAGWVMSMIGAVIETRSLYLMRCWDNATRAAERAIGRCEYQTAESTFTQYIRHHPQRPEDLVMRFRFIKSTVFATTLPWAFAVMWSRLFVRVEDGIPQPLITIGWVVFWLNLVLLALYWIVFFVMTFPRRFMSLNDDLKRADQLAEKAIKDDSSTTTTKGVIWRHGIVTVIINRSCLDDSQACKNEVKRIAFVIQRAMWNGDSQEFSSELHEVDVVVQCRATNQYGEYIIRTLGEADLTAAHARLLDWCNLVDGEAAWQRYDHTELGVTVRAKAG